MGLNALILLFTRAYCFRGFDVPFISIDMLSNFWSLPYHYFYQTFVSHSFKTEHQSQDISYLSPSSHVYSYSESQNMNASNFLSLILCGIKSNPAWMFYQKNSYRLLACKYESWYQVVQKCQILVEMGLFNLNKLCSICVLLIWCSNCFFIEVTKQACLWHYRVCLLLCLLTVQILWLQICSGKIFF